MNVLAGRTRRCAGQASPSALAGRPRGSVAITAARLGRGAGSAARSRGVCAAFVLRDEVALAPPLSVVARTGDTIPYLFIVPEYVSDFGQELKVVGSLPELGEWNASRAPAMSWCAGHRWKLDITLPKTSFEFKVIMTHGNYTRWEQGVNRIVQAHVDNDTHLQGASADPVEVIIKVNCPFDYTTDTQLALMVPVERMKGAFEMAQAALELLDNRKRKLQREIEKDREKQHVAPSREVEMHAMAEAVAGQAKSVSSMSELIQQAEQDKESCVSVPIKRVHVPWGASIGALAKLAAATFLTPEEAAALLAPPASVRTRMAEEAAKAAAAYEAEQTAKAEEEAKATAARAAEEAAAARAAEEAAAAKAAEQAAAAKAEIEARVARAEREAAEAAEAEQKAAAAKAVAQEAAIAKAEAQEAAAAKAGAEAEAARVAAEAETAKAAQEAADVRAREEEEAKAAHLAAMAQMVKPLALARAEAALSEAAREAAQQDAARAAAAWAAEAVADEAAATEAAQAAAKLEVVEQAAHAAQAATASAEALVAAPEGVTLPEAAAVNSAVLAAKAEDATAEPASVTAAAEPALAPPPPTTAAPAAPAAAVVAPAEARNPVVPYASVRMGQTLPAELVPSADAQVLAFVKEPEPVAAEEVQARQRSQAQAARDLDNVCQRLQDFFARNPTPGALGGATANGSEAGPLSEAAQAEVKELTALMAEAEDAWRMAKSLSIDEEDEEEVVYRFDNPSVQNELSQAAAMQAFARDQLAMRMASAGGTDSQPQPQQVAAEVSVPTATEASSNADGLQPPAAVPSPAEAAAAAAAAAEATAAAAAEAERLAAELASIFAASQDAASEQNGVQNGKLSHHAEQQDEGRSGQEGGSTTSSGWGWFPRPGGAQANGTQPTAAGGEVAAQRSAVLTVERVQEAPTEAAAPEAVAAAAPEAAVEETPAQQQQQQQQQQEKADQKKANPFIKFWSFFKP